MERISGASTMKEKIKKPPAGRVKKKIKEPDTSFEFICEWFKKANKQALAQGRKDSAKLWEDGLKHLKYYHALLEPKGKEEK